jgi:hypothetical protein
VILIVGANGPDLVTIREIEIELGSANQGDLVSRRGPETGHGFANTFGRIIVIIIETYTDIPLRQLIEAIPFGTDLELLAFGDLVVSDVLQTGSLEEIADLVRTIIEDDPLHAILGIGLILETANGGRDEFTPVVRRRKYGYERSSGHGGLLTI